MQFIVRMPKLSPTMTKGTIVKWHKKEGEFVKDGELLISIATDKATVEFYAIDEGFLRKIIVRENQEAQLNEPLAIFTSSEDEKIEDIAPEDQKKEEQKAPEKTEEQPQEKEKKTEEKKEDTSTKPQEKVGYAKPQFVPEPPLKEYQFPFPTEDITERILASPLAKKIAKEKNLDLSTIKGTGPDGRIMSRDLDLGQKQSTIHFGPKEIPPIPPGTYEEKEPQPLRKIVGTKMADAKTFIPHFYVTQKVTVDELISVKKEMKEEGINITYNDFIIKACALALKEFPEMNSGYNMKTDKIIYFKTIDIAVAVGIEGGIITPILRYADIKNIAQISMEAKLLAQKARDGAIEEYEYKGGSFTISNLGMYGISSFSAILNPPQTAILAVGGIEQEAAVHEGNVVVKNTMTLTLSTDHRVVDGVQSAIFIKKIEHFLQRPALLLV